jgi:hypothetical protein
MSMQFAKVLVPPPVVLPRGAAWTGALLARLDRAGRSAWRVLEEVGQARANRELQRLAVRYAHQPAFAQALRDAMHHAAMHRDSQH